MADRFPIVALLLLGAALLSGCTAFAGSFESVPALDLRPGFSYSFEQKVDGSGKETEYLNGTVKQSQSGEEHEGFRPMQSYTVLATGQEFQGARYSLALGQYGAGPTHGYLTAIRESDYASTGGYVADGKLYLGEPSDGPLRFPLVPGDSWSTHENFFGSKAGDGSVLIESTVIGARTWTGPQGEVDAILVHHVLGVDQSKVKDSYESESAQEGMRDASIDVSLDGSVDMLYAPSLHAIVSTKASFTMSLDVSGTDEKGTHRYVVERSTDTETRLVESHLEERAPLSLAQIEETLKTGVIPGVAVSTGTLQARNGNITLTASLPAPRNTVGLTGSVARFVVTAENAHSPLKLVATSPSGSTAGGSVEGNAASFQVREAGIHTVRISTTGSDAPVSLTLAVPVDLRIVMDADCPTTATGNPCAPLEFMVGPDMGPVTFAVGRQGLAGEPGLGRLDLTDGSGSGRSAQMVGNAQAVTQAGAPGGYSASYAPTGLVGGITYTVSASANTPGVPVPHRVAAWSGLPSVLVPFK